MKIKVKYGSGSSRDTNGPGIALSSGDSVAFGWSDGDGLSTGVGDGIGGRCRFYPWIHPWDKS